MTLSRNQKKSTQALEPALIKAQAGLLVGLLESSADQMGFSNKPESRWTVTSWSSKMIGGALAAWKADEALAEASHASLPYSAAPLRFKGAPGGE